MQSFGSESTEKIAFCFVYFVYEYNRCACGEVLEFSGLKFRFETAFSSK